jgi:hypothetical protein
VRRPVPPPGSNTRAERAGCHSCGDASRHGGRLRRAERSAAGALSVQWDHELLSAGRFAFVTPECLSAASVRAEHVGLAEVAASSALPPSEDGGAGRKNWEVLVPTALATPRNMTRYSSAAREASCRVRMREQIALGPASSNERMPSPESRQARTRNRHARESAPAAKPTGQVNQ